MGSLFGRKGRPNAAVPQQGKRKRTFPGPATSPAKTLGRAYYSPTVFHIRQRAEKMSLSGPFWCYISTAHPPLARVPGSILFSVSPTFNYPPMSIFPVSFFRPLADLSNSRPSSWSSIVVHRSCLPRCNRYWSCPLPGPGFRLWPARYSVVLAIFVSSCVLGACPICMRGMHLQSIYGNKHKKYWIGKGPWPCHVFLLLANRCSCLGGVGASPVCPISIPILPCPSWKAAGPRGDCRFLPARPEKCCKASVVSLTSLLNLLRFPGSPASIAY